MLSTGLKNRQIITTIHHKWTSTRINSFSTSSAVDLNINGKDGHYDIIIAGGGMVGTTLASSLAKNTKLSNKSVLLLEGAPKFKGFSSNEYSNRVSALSKGTKSLMESIGAWEIIESVRHKPVKQMQVWDASSDAAITFSHENLADDVCYIVENDLILDSVYKTLEGIENVSIKNDSRIESCALPKDGHASSSVQLKTGKNYSCQLLIGADGFNSLVRKQMDVNNFALSYKQMGLVATVELSDAGSNTTAWQRFLPKGPVALLPLNENQSSIVWTTTPEDAKMLRELSDEDFVTALNEAFTKQYSSDQIVKNIMKGVESLLGNITGGLRQLPPSVKSVQDKSRAIFPLGFGHAASYVSEGTALIGDAAHRVHPLAGQGVNLGFGDVKCLTEILSKAAYSGSSLGDLTHLSKYERERLQHNVPIMLGVHGLQRMYSTDFSPFVVLRSIGLQVTQSVPVLKKLFMDKAMV